MNGPLKIALSMTVLCMLGLVPIRNARAEDESDRPGGKEQAAVDSANKELETVYRELMSKAENPQEERSLRDAQRAWIKWREAEAEYVGRHGGAIGGSALRVAYAEAELKLINDRIEVLKEYASQEPED